MMQGTGNRDQGSTAELALSKTDESALVLDHSEEEALQAARMLPATRLFTNVEKALAIDKTKSMRNQMREFMCIRDQVLVLPVEKEQMIGLIHLPASAQEKESEGIVIAVGRGRVDANNVFVPTEVQPGDRVLFGKYGGTEYKLQGKDCRLMREEEILGVIR